MRFSKCRCCDLYGICDIQENIGSRATSADEANAMAECCDGPYTGEDGPEDWTDEDEHTG